jgi:hypothetical protein
VGVVLGHELEKDFELVLLFVLIEQSFELHTELVPVILRIFERRLQLLLTLRGARSRLSNLEGGDALAQADHFENIGLNFLTPEPKFLAASTNLGLKTLTIELQALIIEPQALDMTPWANLCSFFSDIN